MKMKKALLTAAGAYALICGGVYYEVMNRHGRVMPMIDKMQKKQAAKGKPKGEVDPRVAWMKAQEYESIILVNGRGQKLQGFLLPADEPSDVYVICAHGYRSRGRSEFRYLTKFYHDAGYNVLLIDHQASGDSEGEFITFGYYESQDLIRWMEYVNDRFGKNVQIVLQGISMGSATTMMACGNPDRPKNIRFAVVDCGYSDMREELCHALEAGHLPSFPVVNTAAWIQKTFFGFPFEAVCPKASVAQTDVPMLFIHGEADNFVPTYMAYDLYEACSAEKDLFLVPGADHSQSYVKDSEGYEAKVMEFAARYLKQEAKNV